MINFKGKKGQEAEIAALVLLMVLLLVGVSIAIKYKIDQFPDPIGKTQYKLVNTYDNGERILYYIDESAKYSRYEAEASLAGSGGLAPTDYCGEYFGFKLLLNDTKSCVPESSDVKRNFEQQFRTAFYDYLSKSVFGVNINSPFEIIIDGNSVTGVSSLKVSLPITDKKVDELKPPTQYIPTPGNYFSNPSDSNSITSCFGYRGQTEGSTVHEGLDFSSRDGLNVHAVADGVVTYSDSDKLQKDMNNCNCWGRVVIDHGDGLKTTFVHLDTIAVKTNDQVKKGQVIGTAGRRGKNSRYQYSSIHLHLEVTSDKIKKIEYDPDTKSQISFKYEYDGTTNTYAINPACFFDISQYKVSDTSKACTQIDQTHLAANKENAVKKFCKIYESMGITLPQDTASTNNQATPPQQQNQPAQPQVSLSQNQQTQQQTQGTSTGIASCSITPSKEMIEKTHLAPCARYYELFQKYKEKHKVDADILFLTSLAFQESKCDPNANFGTNKEEQGLGIMQVTRTNCNKIAPSKCQPNNPDGQIDLGLQIFSDFQKTIKKKANDFSVNDVFVLTVYAYNRGYGPIWPTLEDQRNNPGKPLIESMKIGCQEFYKGKKDVNGNDLCTLPGYGPTYPLAIENHYKQACQELGGVAGGAVGGTPGQTYDYTAPTVTYSSIGAYSFVPAFKTSLEVDFSVYQKIYDSLSKFSEWYNDDTTNKQALLQSLIDNPSAVLGNGLSWSSDCDLDDEKAFYAFAEQYADCANTSGNCSCEIRIPSTIPSESEFEIETQGQDTVFRHNGKEELIKGKKFGVINIVGNIDPLSSATVKVSKKDDSSYTISVNPGLLKPTQIYDLKFSDPIILYKNPGSIGIPDTLAYPTYLLKYANNEALKCDIEKKAVKLCVKQGEKIPMYDPKTNKVEYDESVIRFAYYFRDFVPPPAVESITQQEKPLSQKQAIIKWKQVDLKGDTDKFIVFISKDEIKQLSFNELEKMASEGTVIRNEYYSKNQALSLSSIDFANPVISLFSGKVESRYTYTQTGKAPVTGNIAEGVLYKVEPSSEYFVKISTNENTKYYTAIFAADSHNNVKAEASIYSSIEIKDMLAPATAPLEGFTFDVFEAERGDLVRIIWNTPPDKNTDGSPFDSQTELGGYDIYFRDNSLDNDFVLGDPQVRILYTGETWVNSDPSRVEKVSYNSVDIKRAENRDDEICGYVVPFDKSMNKQYNTHTRHLMDDLSFFNWNAFCN